MAATNMRPLIDRQLVRFDTVLGVLFAGLCRAKNNTGSTITMGMLVKRFGYNQAAGSDEFSAGPSISPVSNTTGEIADGVAFEDIPAGAYGYINDRFLIGGIDTSAASVVGAPVYLGTAGGTTFTPPDPLVARRQVVGYVQVKDATNGQIEFDLRQFANVGQPPGQIPGPLKAVVRLTNAQVKALRATPVVLVAAPGAGKLLLVGYGSIRYHYATAAYTITAGGDDLAIRYHNGSGAKASTDIDTTGVIDQTVDMLQLFTPNTALKGVASDCVNQPLVAHNIGANEWTGGNASAYVEITLIYSIVDAG